MSLQSQLFRGNPQLEAAAVSDPAHIVRGAVGLHVSKIQQALAILDGAVIDPAELQKSQYGSSTASAVLAYKQRRKIINRSYQTEPDDIVGKMTTASLDQELLVKDSPGPTKVSPAPKKSVVTTVKFVFNAFIPRDVPGVTLPVRNGPFLGSTFLFGPPLPNLAMPPNPNINPFLLPIPLPVPAFPSQHDGLFRPAFLTNDRTFSLSDTRSLDHFKMHADVTATFDGHPRISDSALLGGRGTLIEPELGTVIRTAVSSNSRMTLTQLSEAPAPDQFFPPSPNSIAIRFDLATGNPLVPLSDAFADIDMTGTLVIDAGFRIVSFNGFVDQFPAFEAFLVADSDPPQQLFQISPLKGNTPMDLPGGATNPVNLSVSF